MILDPLILHSLLLGMYEEHRMMMQKHEYNDAIKWIKDLIKCELHDYDKANVMRTAYIIVKNNPIYSNSSIKEIIIFEEEKCLARLKHKRVVKKYNDELIKAKTDQQN